MNQDLKDREKGVFGPLRDADDLVKIFTHSFAGGALESVARIESVTHPEYRGIQPQMPVARGRQGFLNLFFRLYALIPDLRASVRSYLASGDVIFLEVTVHGTLGGKPIELEVCDRFQLKDGMIFERRAYGDPLTLLIAILTRPSCWVRWWQSGFGFPRRKVSRKLAPALIALQKKAEVQATPHLENQAKLTEDPAGRKGRF